MNILEAIEKSSPAMGELYLTPRQLFRLQIMFSVRVWWVFQRRAVHAPKGCIAVIDDKKLYIRKERSSFPGIDDELFNWEKT